MAKIFSSLSLNKSKNIYIAMDNGSGHWWVEKTMAIVI